MKNFLCVLIVCSATLLISCKNNANNLVPTTPDISVNGKWNYDKNLVGSCDDLVSTIWEIKNAEATVLSVPANPYLFKVGEKMLTNITQTTSPNNFTAIGYGRYSGGEKTDPKKVELTVSTGLESMTVTYPGVCNSVQLWVKSK